ncbi:hypothetical protein [Pseudonocardia phyllosphaerae]|uniref:hypothetical protein n=1 Tax=Pseudonocardia phyllosphaerae TaxID=3390502 RepID=UPI00397D7CDD
MSSFTDLIPDDIHGIEISSGRYLIVDGGTVTVDDRDFVHFTSRGRRVSVNLDAIRVINERTLPRDSDRG